jgi:hypothetical protein
MSHDTTTNFIDTYLWIQVCEILKWHNKGNDRCIDTLNRLWQKHSEVRSPSGEILMDVPVLSEDMLSVSTERWRLDELAALNRSHFRDRPLSFPPIVVLRWFDRDFLIDGTTRINFWLKLGNAGPHAVLKIVQRKE